MWLGQACFYIRCNGTSVVLDPYFQQEKVGFDRWSDLFSVPIRSLSASTRQIGFLSLMLITTTSMMLFR